MQMIALDNPLAGTTTTGRADAARAVGTGRVLSRLAVLFLVFDSGDTLFHAQPVIGQSSGGALALDAAASGLGVDKVVAYEPPYVDDTGQRGGAAHEDQLTRLFAEGNRGGAVKYFMKDMVGAPAALVILLRLMPWIWRKLEAVAHTLPYDAAVMTQFKIPRARLASIAVPVLVMHGSKSDGRLREAARAIAEAIPGAQHRELAGQTHNVKPGVLTPPVVEFFGASIARTSSRS